MKAFIRRASQKPGAIIGAQGRTAFLLMAPYLLLFTIFTVIPVIISIFLSFTDFNIMQPPKFVGLENYSQLFLSDDVFLIALKNTIVYALAVGPFGYILSLLVAWLINELPPKLRAVIIVIFYAPSISGNVYVIWKTIFSSDNMGIVNGFLLKNGLLVEPVEWLQNPQTMLWVIILAALWLSMGTGFLSFVAGLQGIDTAMYEAGAIDGIRNRWQELWYITLPLIKPQLLFGAVMSITSAFSVSTVCMNLAGFPSMQYGAHTIVIHLLDYGNLRLDMGYASAIATVLFFLMVGCNKLVGRILRNIGK